MKTLLAVMLLSLPSAGLAAVDDQAGPSTAQPMAPQPNLAPPAPPENPEPPAEQAALTTSDQAPSSGQWVYTQQYGWVWMPYGDNYTYQPTDGGAPDMYVYYPTVGWTWVVAPWVWGWGAQPYFGIYGTARFGWYGYGYGHWYGFRGPYANWSGRGYWNGGHWYGAAVHPAAPRGGFAVAPHSGYVTGRGSYAAPRSAYAAPRGGYYAAPRGSYAAPRGSYGGGATFGGHPGASFGGHPAGGSGGHGGGGGGGHGGGGHR